MVAKNKSWNTVEVIDVASHIRDGTNVITVKVTHTGDNGGLLAKMTVATGNDQNTSDLVTDQSWRMSREVSDDRWTKPGFDDRNWTKAHTHGVNGDEPWGEIQFNPPQ